MAKIKVAVIFGGVSTEHDISLISATNVMQNLSAEKYEIIPIGITKKGRWLFYPGSISAISGGSCAFTASGSRSSGMRQSVRKFAQ